jgi:hypothetical protein
VISSVRTVIRSAVFETFGGAKNSLPILDASMLKKRLDVAWKNL